MSGCRKCGKRCHGRYCKNCGRAEHREQRLSPHERVTETETLLYDCTGCGARYRSDSPGDCPHCDHYGARYAGDDADKPPLVADGGQTTEDYIDLGERYDDRFDRPDECRCNEQLVKGALCIPCSQAGFGTPNPEVN
jgi:hypothetical protein